MTVTLSKEATEFVEAQMRTGAFATPSDVIDFAVELDKARRMLAQRDNEEIKALLLEAIDSPCTQIGRAHV